MANVTLEFVGTNKALKTLTINNKHVKVKKDRDGKKRCQFETNEPEVEIRISQNHYYYGKNWFWWNLLYYVVSIFGIFDIRQNTKFLVIDCVFKLHITEDTTATLKILNFQDGGKFLEIQSNADVEEISNKYYFDKEAKQKHRKMKKAKIGVLITSAILIAVLVMLI